MLAKPLRICRDLSLTAKQLLNSQDRYSLASPVSPLFSFCQAFLSSKLPLSAFSTLSCHHRPAVFIQVISLQFVLYLSRRVKRWICSPASHQYLFCSSQASVFRFVQRSVYSPQLRLICLFKLRRTRELSAFCACVNSSSSSCAISFRFCSHRCSVPPSHPPCSSVYTASLGPDYQPPSHQLSFPERPSQPCLLLVGSRGLVSIRHWMLSEFVSRSVSAFGELSQHSAVHQGSMSVSFSTPAVDLVHVPILFCFPFLALEGREPTMLCRSCSIRGCS